jgi:hypothetical protein
MRLEHEATSVRVDERMALASFDLLSSIETAWLAGLGGLDTLAVDDRGQGAGLAPDPFAICHHECMVYPFKARSPHGRKLPQRSRSDFEPAQ